MLFTQHDPQEKGLTELAWLSPWLAFHPDVSWIHTEFVLEFERSSLVLKLIGA
jgi:hypothetical protein